MKGIISGFVQLFFAWRIFVLTSNVCLCGIVVLLALLGTGNLSSPVICYSNLGMIAGGIATAAECGITSQFLQFQRFQVRRIIFLYLPNVTANATIGRRHYLASVRLLV